MAGSRQIKVEFLGDGKNLSSTLGDVESRTGKFGATMGKVGKMAALGLAAGIGAAGVALVGMTKNAVEDEAAQRKLALALQNSVGATDKTVASVEKWISKQGEALGVTDDELRPAFQRLVQATGSVGEAQRQMGIAMDVSAGTGKSLETVSSALMKANNGTTASLSKLGLKTKDAEGNTLSLKDALSSMSSTFEGQATAKAETLGGKMDRLKLIFDETKESIGARLIPVISDMADWFLNKAMPAISKVGDWLEVHLMPTLRDLGDWIETKVVPAVKKFADEMQSGQGAGGKFADALGKMRDGLEKAWDILQPVINFIADNKTVVATFAGVILTVVAAVKVWTAVQTAFNIVMSANPIGLVVVAIAALAAGLVYAYKKSETFRNIVDGALEGVQTAFRFMWNNVVQPVLKFMIGGIADVMDMFGSLLDALSKVPGFGWVSGVADKMHNAADKTRDLADNIRDIPTSKTVTITVNVNAQGKNSDMLGDIVGRGAVGSKGGNGGGGKFGDEWGGNAGRDLIGSLVAGIRKHKVKLDTVMEEVRGFIAKKMGQLQTLLDKRQAIVDSFKGMTSSIFSMGMDPTTNEDGTTTPKSVTDLLAFQADQRARAETLRNSVGSLTSKGLSPDLIRQMLAAGQSGQDQINLLATATSDQIAQANADNLATQQALAAAGLETSKALGIEADIRATERDLRLADTIKTKLDELMKQQDKNTIVELHLDGQRIYVSLKKLRRQHGQGLGLG